MNLPTVLSRWLARWHPLRLLVLGYGSYVLITWLLLCLPLSWSEAGPRALDNLFVATSAVSTTGLSPVGIDQYSLFGQIVLLVAFQLGGLGYMTLGSFVLLSNGDDLPEVRDRVGRAAFSLPEGFELETFLRHVVIATGLVEAAGICALYFAFKDAGVANPLWPAVFHSVSAFCTAGFSTFGSGLEAFRGHFWVNASISSLSLLGAIGFLVVSDFWLTLVGQRERMTLTSKIILHFTLWSIAAGAAWLFVTEPSLAPLPPPERILAAVFQALSALTTVGFNTHPVGAFAKSTVLVMVFLMIMGASPSGTGGGLKTTSVSAVLAVLVSVLKRRPAVTFWGRKVPRYRLNMAIAASAFYALMLSGGGVLLLLSESGLPFGDVLFEAASALGTVGLSCGITGELSSLGKLVVIALMFAGRVGPLTLGLALFSEGPSDPPQVEDLAV